jgi:conjugal transfer pilus assembly protein TraW
MILESAARADWEKAQRELATAAESYADRLPQRRLPIPPRLQTRWIDPSITVDSDIKIPVKQADGEYAWRVLYKAGTRVNPLATMAPRTALLFFSGTDPKQVALAKRLWAAAPGIVTPVDVSGANVEKLSQAVGFPVFYAHDSMLARFNIDKAPALLYAGSTTHRLSLGLTYLPSPFSDTAALSAIAHLIPTTPAYPRQK